MVRALLRPSGLTPFYSHPRPRRSSAIVFKQTVGPVLQPPSMRIDTPQHSSFHKGAMQRGIVPSLLAGYERCRAAHPFLTNFATMAGAYLGGNTIAEMLNGGALPGGGMRSAVLLGLSAFYAWSYGHVFETVDREIPLPKDGKNRRELEITKFKRAAVDAFGLSPLWTVGHVAAMALARGTETSTAQLFEQGLLGVWLPFLPLTFFVARFLHGEPPLQRRLPVRATYDFSWQAVVSALPFF